MLQLNYLIYHGSLSKRKPQMQMSDLRLAWSIKMVLHLSNVTLVQCFSLASSI